MLVVCNWLDVKNYSIKYSIPIKYAELSDSYIVSVQDSYFEITCKIVKSDTPSADQVDFETNYKT